MQELQSIQVQASVKDRFVFHQTILSHLFYLFPFPYSLEYF